MESGKDDAIAHLSDQLSGINHKVTESRKKQQNVLSLLTKTSTLLFTK